MNELGERANNNNQEYICLPHSVFITTSAKSFSASECVSQTRYLRTYFVVCWMFLFTPSHTYAHTYINFKQISIREFKLQMRMWGVRTRVQREPSALVTNSKRCQPKAHPKSTSLCSCFPRHPNGFAATENMPKFAKKRRNCEKQFRNCNASQSICFNFHLLARRAAFVCARRFYFSLVGDPFVE